MVESVIHPQVASLLQINLLRITHTHFASLFKLILKPRLDCQSLSFYTHFGSLAYCKLFLHIFWF